MMQLMVIDGGIRSSHVKDNFSSSASCINNNKQEKIKNITLTIDSYIELASIMQ